MIRKAFARKERQLNYNIKKLNRFINQPTNNYNLEIERLLHKIKDLIESLKYQISQYNLRKMIGSLSIMIGVAFTNENKINAQSFGSPINNPFGIDLLDTALFPFSSFGDLDNDGDLDILSAQKIADNSSYWGASDSWFYQENIGTASTPQFNPAIINPFNLSPIPLGDDDSFGVPKLVDLDGDGDLDILATEIYSLGYSGISFHYIENIGTPSTPNYNTWVTNPFGLDSSSFLFCDIVDIDNDGDLDIIGSLPNWYGSINLFLAENIGSSTNPQFSPPTSNLFSLTGVNGLGKSIAISDIDSDGDFDIITKSNVAVYYDTQDFYYHENIGNASSPQFLTPPITNPFNLLNDTNHVVYAISDFADLDGDGDEDLICNNTNFPASVHDVIYYEHDGSLNSLATIANRVYLEVYPNPAKNILYIKGNKNINNVRIIDELGKVIKNEMISRNTINIASLKQGVYLIEMLCENQIITKKFIK